MIREEIYTHAQHSQRAQEWGPPQRKYCAALMS